MPSVRLFVLRGLPFDSQIGGYDFYSNHLEASEGILLGCRDTACISHSLLHEMGHACVRARLDTHHELSIYSEGIRDEGDCHGELTRPTNQMMQTLNAIFGVSTAECVARSIRARPGPCFVTRLGEAVADGVFMSEWTKLSSFAWDCSANEDQDHANPLAYLPCFLKRPEINRNFCPSAGP